MNIQFFVEFANYHLNAAFNIGPDHCSRFAQALALRKIINACALPSALMYLNFKRAFAVELYKKAFCAISIKIERIPRL